MIDCTLAVSEASLKNATDEITSIKPILSADKDKTKSLPGKVACACTNIC